MNLLRYGSRGDAVRDVQGGLNFAGGSRFPALETDGIFGARTQARVYEFQGQQRLGADGVVGPKTLGALEAYIKLFLEHVNTQVRPEDEAAARKRIVDIAIRMHQMHGWRDIDRVGGDRTRIAMNKQVDPITEERQGGTILALIAGLTGNDQILPARCLTISKKDVERYQNNLPPNDVGKWCGAFVFAVYKLAGLKLGTWPMIVKGNEKPWQTPLFESVTRASDIQPGDYGVSQWNKENHHFLVVGTEGPLLRTIEGNVNFKLPHKNHLTIVDRRKFSIHGILNDKYSGFGRPIWTQVLKG